MNDAQRALDESRVKYDVLNTQLQAARGAAEKAREDATSLYAVPSYSSSEEVAAYQSALSRAETLKQKAEQIAAQLETASSDVDSKRTSLSSAKSASAGQLRKVIELLSDEQLFKGVPWDGPKATTNSDGQFSMKLVSNKRYVIAAKAQRRVFDSTEQYYWLVWVSLQGEEPMRVMLNNNNLMGTDSADTVFKSKELIPTGITEH